MTQIIAEIGSNHLGDYEVGKKLIKSCKDIGCSLIKMQLWKADDLYKDSPIYEQTKKLELSFDLAKRFFDYANTIGIDLFFSVFYDDAVDFCEEIGVKYYKIAARSVRNYSLLVKVAKTGKPVFVSFSVEGIQRDMDKVKEIFRNVLSSGDIIPFYTVSKYPPEFSDFDVSVLKKIVLQNGGYSNHYLHEYTCIFAALLGASWIEIHVISRKYFSSPDVVCSWDFKQLDEFKKEWIDE